MDLLGAYYDGYKQVKAKVLSKDEKAFIEGFNAAVQVVKNAYFNVDDILNEKPSFAKMEKEIIKQFCEHVDVYVTGDYLDRVISFMDNRLCEQNKTCEDTDSVVVIPNNDWIWNTENYDPSEPVNIVEEESDEEKSDEEK